MSQALAKERSCAPLVRKFTEPSMTEQSHTPRCDINRIMAKFAATGVVEHVRDARATYGEVPSTDYFTACALVAKAKSDFELIPAEMRQKQFGNDVGAYLDWLQTLPEEPQEGDVNAAVAALERAPAAPDSDAEGGAEEGQPIEST